MAQFQFDDTTALYTIPHLDLSQKDTLDEYNEVYRLVIGIIAPRPEDKVLYSLLFDAIETKKNGIFIPGFSVQEDEKVLLAGLATIHKIEYGDDTLYEIEIALCDATFITKEEYARRRNDATVKGKKNYRKRKITSKNKSK